MRAFTVDEIGDAVDVRGVLEGMAARLLAERGAPKVLAQLEQAVEEGRQLLAPAGSEPRWTRAPGARSTGAFTKSCARPPATARCCRRWNTQQDAAGRPGRADAAVHPSLLETPFVLRAADHEDLLRAITRREAVRAENLMREHAYRSRENKRVLLESFAARWPRGRCWRTPALEMSARLASRLSYADR